MVMYNLVCEDRYVMFAFVLLFCCSPPTLRCTFTVSQLWCYCDDGILSLKVKIAMLFAESQKCKEVMYIILSNCPTFACRIHLVRVDVYRYFWASLITFVGLT